MLQLWLQESPLQEWLMRVFRRLWVFNCSFLLSQDFKKFILMLLMTSFLSLIGCCIEGFWPSSCHKCQCQTGCTTKEAQPSCPSNHYHWILPSDPWIEKGATWIQGFQVRYSHGAYNSAFFTIFLLLLTQILFFHRISEEEYVTSIKEEIRKVVELQEKLDIDVLVHGEPEVSSHLHLRTKYLYSTDTLSVSCLVYVYFPRLIMMLLIPECTSN
jgi:hypothetical protein